MSHKSGKIAALVEKFQHQERDARYLAYFDCFNRQLFYEAHDVLEELWLADRQGSNGAFYKGLIQLAGAFVHLQKNRLRPAAALFTLAQTNLQKYPPFHDDLDVARVRRLIDGWSQQLADADFTVNPLVTESPPRLALQGVSNGPSV